MVSSRKPIYDDELSAAHQLPSPALQAEKGAQQTSRAVQEPPAAVTEAAPTSSSQTPQQPQLQQQQQQLAQSFPTLTSRLTGSHQTPTDRLAEEVRRARIFVYRHSLSAETSLNDFLTRALNHEMRIANTIASLAPSPSTGEKLLPGAVYVGVSGMAGSILARNRGVFLRTVTPLAFAGVAAAWCLPVTMGNVGNLVYEWEKQVPGLAERHVAVKERVGRFVDTGIAHSGMAGEMLEGQVGRGRKVIEEWLKRGN
ncbi:hypothetical protein KEM56_007266 [Ascosphaera pollenicola]|nr:hypothetical protein KEM56_007266 [Ascosphaera pollenicola]